MQKKSVRRLFPGLSLALGVAGVTRSQPAGLVPGTQARARGCRDGGPGNINRVRPQWVSVQAADTPRVAGGVVTLSKVTHEDNPANHTSHDWNFDVVLDPAFQGLHSDANPVEDGQRQMEMEWETRFFPPQFWPVAGDHVWMMGRWIFDCGHPPYRTELHPVKAVAFTRLEPTLFPGQTMPALTNRVYVYLNGRGGYFRAPVAVQNYEFDVPLPPKPFADTPLRFNQLRAEVLSLPFGGPRPVLTPQPTRNPTRVHVVYPLGRGNSDPALRFGARQLRDRPRREHRDAALSLGLSYNRERAGLAPTLSVPPSPGNVGHASTSVDLSKREHQVRRGPLLRVWTVIQVLVVRPGVVGVG